jgi:tetratricopeptide (TPR) repeat protein
MKHSIFLHYFPMALLAALAACSQPAPVVKPPSQPDQDSAAMVAAIRAAGAQFDSSVEVHPLREPAAEGLFKQARDLEAHEQLDAALAAVSKALRIAPDAPDILQYQAELEVEMRAWQQAMDAAQKSYDLGPKVGALCARNLETLAIARTQLGDVAGAGQARQQLTGCRVPPAVRL